MTLRKPPTRLESSEAWWAFLSRVIAFFAGLGLVVYMTISHYVEGYLVAAAIGMMGFPVVGPVIEILKRLPGGGGE